MLLLIAASAAAAAAAEMSRSVCAELGTSESRVTLDL